jgi:hypothetical protein
MLDLRAWEGSDSAELGYSDDLITAGCVRFKFADASGIRSNLPQLSWGSGRVLGSLRVEYLFEPNDGQIVGSLLYPYLEKEPHE